MEYKKIIQSYSSKIAAKNKQLNQAIWLLETTGSQDAADLKAALDTEFRLLLSDRQIYEQLIEAEKDPSLQDPLLQRQINILIRAFKQQMIPQNLIIETTQQEAQLLYHYANFRPQLNGKSLSENDIRTLLKTEKNPSQRQKIWEASKEIGTILAPDILRVVHLRNQAALHIGYNDYFQMQLALQEVDEKWLFQLLNELAEQSEAAYLEVLQEIETEQCHRFNVTPKELGPWAWSEPFCQEDPINTSELDALVKDLDINAACIAFYAKMNIDVQPIFARSDMFERPGKNQHAFCINMDRASDIRMLNNVKPTIKWLETVLHECGHAIYEMGFDKNLPWLLREPPHMLTTEAMALLAGLQAYLSGFFHQSKQAESSLRRRQLIFSRWVLVMTHFERELYLDPQQDLNQLWWQMVEKYQKISASRIGASDWAAKYHIGLAPVYYYSYLLGELFASTIHLKVQPLGSSQAGHFLQKKLFSPGNRMHWTELVQHVTGEPLNTQAWMQQFAL